jgi:hypothetical protein
MTRLLKFLMWSSLLLGAVAFVQRRRPIPHGDIRPDLARSPRQTPSAERPFSFRYRHANYNVQPVADYELWGLVVSHNNIGSIADIYHDENSLDTKDLCVIWGDNVQTDDFHQVKFWNGPWTCNWRYPGDTSLRADQVSNNHLVTDRDSLRRAIATVRIGDQIRLRGMLVNYQRADQPEWWRRSSTNRQDTGDGACEVVFVRDLDVLRPGRPGWYGLFRWAKVLFVASLTLLLLGALWPGGRKNIVAEGEIGG